MCHQKQSVPIIYCFHITESTHTYIQSTHIGSKRKEEEDILITFANKQRCHDSCLFFPRNLQRILNDGAHFINSERGGGGGNEFSWKCNFHQPLNKSSSLTV